MKVGDRRINSAFLWWPKTTYFNGTKWMCQAYWVEEVYLKTFLVPGGPITTNPPRFRAWAFREWMEPADKIRLCNNRHCWDIEDGNLVGHPIETHLCPKCSARIHTFTGDVEC